MFRIKYISLWYCHKTIITIVREKVGTVFRTVGFNWEGLRASLFLSAVIMQILMEYKKT
jgi:hypothetical protein